MPASCVVKTCSNRYNHGQDVSFHKFPTEADLCKKWIEFSGRRDWKPTKWSSICSRHFEKQCFKEYLHKKCLRPDAIPTITDVPESTQLLETLMTNSEAPEESGSFQKPSTSTTLTAKTNNVRFTSQDIENAPVMWEVSEPDIKHIHEEEVATSKPVSEQNDIDFEIQEQEQDFQEPDYTDANDGIIPDEPYDQLEQETESIERLCEILCRLCGGTFNEQQLVCYSSFLNLIIKCFPTLNLENYEYFPKQICFDCREKLINFSIFIDKTMTAQKYLTDQLIYNLPNITENFLDNKKIMPRIKQEPIVVIKEEKVDKKIDFSSKGKGTTVHTLKDKITFKDSKHCEIIKIVNLNTPLIDLKNRQSSPQKKPAEQPVIQSQPPLKRIIPVTQTQVLDDDIEILSPTPLKVEEIIEGDEIEESRIKQQAVMKVDHNYSRSPYANVYPGKIEILEERVYKTEIIEAPIFTIDEPNSEPNGDTNRLCTICNFIFDSSVALKRHNAENHLQGTTSDNKKVIIKNDVRVCTLCNIGFSSVQKYLSHKMTIHSKPKVYFCRLCNKYFAIKNLYFKHMKNRKCFLKKKFRVKFNFLKSSQTNQELVQFNQTSFTEKARENQTVQHDADEMSCTDMEQIIEEVLQEDYLPDEIEIPSHDSEFEQSTMEMHFNNNDLIRNLECSKCGRCYPRQYLLTAHETSHRPVEQWDSQCRFCELLYDNPSDLHWHIKHNCQGVKEVKTTSPSSSQIFYTCQICGTQLSSLWSLKNHENIHSRKITFKCQVQECGKEFISKQNLAQHQLSHSEERNYRCHLCEKVFKRSGGLNQHINGFHLNIKPHVCSVCKKSYALKADMIRCKHSLLKYVGEINVT